MKQGIRLVFLLLCVQQITVCTVININTPRGQYAQGGRGGCSIYDLVAAEHLLALTRDQLRNLQPVDIERLISQGIEKYRDIFQHSEIFRNYRERLDKQIQKHDLARVRLDFDRYISEGFDADIRRLHELLVVELPLQYDNDAYRVELRKNKVLEKNLKSEIDQKIRLELSVTQRLFMTPGSLLGDFKNLRKIGSEFQVVAPEESNVDFGLYPKTTIIDRLEHELQPTCAVFVSDAGESMLICRFNDLWGYFDSHRQTDGSPGASLRIFSTPHEFKHFFEHDRHVRVVAGHPADITMIALKNIPAPASSAVRPALPPVRPPFMPVQPVASSSRATEEQAPVRFSSGVRSVVVNKLADRLLAAAQNGATIPAKINRTRSELVAVLGDTSVATRIVEAMRQGRKDLIITNLENLHDDAILSGLLKKYAGS